MELQQFCKDLPKVELHAHLNGSLSDATLKKLHQLKNTSSCSENSCWNQWEAIIDNGQKRTLEECFQLFNVAHSVTTSPAALRKATHDVINEFAHDGVVYLELRSTPREIPGIMTKSQYIEAIVKTILDDTSLHKIIVKLLVSVDRRQGKLAAEETLNLVLEARKDYPDIVLGLDLSGDPTKGAIADYLQVMEQARNMGLKIAIHCAEVPNEAEVSRILEFKPDRIGHATCIHPEHGGSEDLWQNLLLSQIPVELCLSSNVKCGTVRSYKEHHFRHFLNSGHPITIATDDKGVFNTSLSEEYHHAALAFNLSREQLWQLSVSSVDSTFTTEEEKQKLRKMCFQWRSNHLTE